MGQLVSILIPVYNARPWVAQAIESALAQTWPNKEIIVLDDGSTDGSMEVIKPYAGRVRIERTSNGGQNVSRNSLAYMSRGDWLFYLDADDELAPDNVEQKMRFADVAEVIYGSMETRTFAGRERVRSEQRVAVDYADPITAAFWWAFPNTSSVGFKRSAVLGVGGWDESVQNCTDYALYFPLLLGGARLRAAPASWSIYRMWSETQAVNEAPVRKMITRLRLMRATAEKLKQTGGWTAARAQEFLDSALGVARLLYVAAPSTAMAEHRLLCGCTGGQRPSPRAFSRSYLAAYHTLGFATTEWLAAKVRRAMPESYCHRSNPCVPALEEVRHDPATAAL